MTLAQLIEFFERSRGSVEIRDHTAREIAKTLRETEDELGTLRREVAAIRTVTEPKRASR